MTDSERQNNITETIRIGSKMYVKPASYLRQSDENPKGSFVNILANRMSLSDAPGKNVSYWR